VETGSGRTGPENGGGVPPARGFGEAPENFEFSAYWDLKIASRQCKIMV